MKIEFSRLQVGPRTLHVGIALCKLGDGGVEVFPGCHAGLRQTDLPIRFLTRKALGRNRRVKRCPCRIDLYPERFGVDDVKEVSLSNGRALLEHASQDDPGDAGAHIGGHHRRDPTRQFVNDRQAFGLYLKDGNFGRYRRSRLALFFFRAPHESDKGADRKQAA